MNSANSHVTMPEGWKIVWRWVAFWWPVVIAAFSIAQEPVPEQNVATVTSELSRGVPREQFLSLDGLDAETKRLSEELLFNALDSEAFYTWAGQLKPVSEGFWGGYFSIEQSDLRELERVRAALKAWNVPGLFHADVLVYESLQFGQRYASAYVVHIPSLKALIQRQQSFFARWGITPETPPNEVLMLIERTRQPDDRWRGFGLVFGYPEPAIDFFVAAGMHQRMTGEFIERDFRHLPTFAGRTGRFVYAVSKLSSVTPEEKALERAATRLLSEYRRLRPQYIQPNKNPTGLLRDWMDDGSGICHPAHLSNKLPTKTDAEWDAEIEKQKNRDAQPPKVLFNHLHVVLSPADFDSLRSSVAAMESLAAVDQGFPKFLPVADDSQAIYLRGQDTYIELFGPNNKFNLPVGKMGLGWSVEKVGELDEVERLLRSENPDGYTRVLNRWDVERETPVDWYHALFRTQPIAAKTVWWFSEYHTDFIPALKSLEPTDAVRIARRDFLESRFDAQRWLKNVNRLNLELPAETALTLRADLENVGWRTEEFDARTWMLIGPEFRLLLHLGPADEATALRSIGFSTNQTNGPVLTERIGSSFEIQLDGKGSGWLLFNR